MTVSAVIEIGTGGPLPPGQFAGSIQGLGKTQGLDGASTAADSSSCTSDADPESFKSNWQAQMATLESGAADPSGELRDGETLDELASGAPLSTAPAPSGAPPHSGLRIPRPGVQTISTEAALATLRPGVAQVKMDSLATGGRATSNAAAGRAAERRKPPDKARPSLSQGADTALTMNSLGLQPGWFTAPQKTATAEPAAHSIAEPGENAIPLALDRRAVASPASVASAALGTAQAGILSAIAGRTQAASTPVEASTIGTSEAVAIPSSVDDSSAAAIPQGTTAGDPGAAGAISRAATFPALLASSSLNEGHAHISATVDSAGNARSEPAEMQTSRKVTQAQIPCNAAAAQASSFAPSSSDGGFSGSRDSGLTSGQAQRRNPSGTGSTASASATAPSQAVDATAVSALQARAAAGEQTASNLADVPGANQSASMLHQTFAALDSASALPAQVWTQTGTRHAEAGFHDATLGWVSVRADLSGGGVHAALVPSSPAAAVELGRHLDGLHSYLAEQHTPVDSLVMAAGAGRGGGWVSDKDLSPGMHQGTGQGGNPAQGQNPEQPTQTESQPGSAESFAGNNTFSAAEVQVAAVETGVSRPGVNGVHISLIA